MTRTLGIVVAGGRGRRLGGEVPKALVPLAGSTLLERAIRTLEPLCDELLVVSSPAVPLTVERHRVIMDAPGASGPLAAVTAGLKAAPYDVALVLAADLPLVGGELFAALRARMGERAAAVPVAEDRLQPLAAVYAPGAAGVLAAAGERGVRSLIEAVHMLDPLLLSEVELAALGIPAGRFLNLNRPEDLAEAELRLAARPAAGATS